MRLRTSDNHVESLVDELGLNERLWLARCRLTQLALQHSSFFDKLCQDLPSEYRIVIDYKIVGPRGTLDQLEHTYCQD